MMESKNLHCKLCDGDEESLSHVDSLSASHGDFSCPSHLRWIFVSIANLYDGDKNENEESLPRMHGDSYSPLQIPTMKNSTPSLSVMETKMETLLLYCSFVQEWKQANSYNDSSSPTIIHMFSWKPPPND
ncbi:hypothetical protein ACOSQ3_012313 [Xanthoceras sorbifolium]